jgi:ADP-heptose:LPS heptosyltransferase
MTRLREPRRILIVNPFGIGDVLFTTPVIRALRLAFPGSHLSYLCNRRTEGILQHNPHLDEIFVYERDELVQSWKASRWAGMAHVTGLLRRLARSRFDLVIDLSLGERYAFILKGLGARRLVGFNYRGRGRFLSASIEIEGYQGEHVIRYYRRLLRFLGIEMVDDRLECHASAADQAWAESWLRENRVDRESLVVGLVPAGGVSWGIDAPFRRWGHEGFAAVADELIDRHGASVILLGEAKDRDICQRVAELMRHEPINASGRTSLGQFISLLARLNLVICNDGGPLHLAVSQGVKTVSIFGPVDPRVYGPYAPGRADHRVVCRGVLPCRPCYHQFKLPPCPYERACLTTIQPDEVLQGCEESLAIGQPAAVHA